MRWCCLREVVGDGEFVCVDDVALHPGACGGDHGGVVRAAEVGWGRGCGCAG